MEDLRAGAAAAPAERGQLKIFFGYAAGVGKTCAMLRAAHGAKAQGTDVVVGYVEAHHRPQTAALLAGLEAVEGRVVSHRGLELRELDLDGVLRRRPGLVLVDELAHTNAPGSRHEKRYQDVEELLRAGIDVYTTVNVQHMESLNDQVAGITGFTVGERIPDRIFDQADQVELVDLEPAQLVERLARGEIYGAGQARQAADHFFRLDKLTALREIALHRCADRVNRQAEGPGLTDEHILVCLSAAPSNEKLIRTGARMAGAFRGRFTALFVETPGFAKLGEEERGRLRAHLHLAQQLGAQVETVYGEDIAFQIAEFARLSGVSKLVLGRSSAKRHRLFGPTALTEHLVSYAPELDIYIIPDKDVRPYAARAKGREPVVWSLPDAAKSLGLLAAATAMGALFDRLGFSEANIITVYILAVLVTSVVTAHRGYSLVSSLLSVLVFNFFFTDPRFSLKAYDAGYPVTFLIMLLSALLTSSLAVRMKQNARQSARTAYRTKTLFDTNRLLQKVRGRAEIVAVTAGQLSKLLARDVVVYLTEGDDLGPPQVFPAGAGAVDPVCLSQEERAVAAWVWRNNTHAGAGTATLSGAKCLYLAVRVGSSVYGVVGIALEGRPLENLENSILLSVLGECALALENERTAREKEAAAVLAQNEQLRANLLRAISHDLRTPLTSISGHASNLLSNAQSFDEETRRQLYGDIYDDAQWLINLVENLLSITRMEEGGVNLSRSVELMEEIIDEALRHIGRRRDRHQITVVAGEEPALVRVDGRLLVQVVINLVDNAIKYTPEGSAVTITTRRTGDLVTVEIADDGPGISSDAKAHVFDMFYTGASQVADSRRSLGLGLSLCKSILHVHGGEIWVGDHLPHGTVFTFTLPAEEVALHE